MLDRELTTRRFDQIIRVPGDSAVIATEAPRRLFTSVARLAIRPFESVRGEVDLISGRDLLRPSQLTDDLASQQLLADQRRRAAGVDLGWEVDRRIQTRLSYQPRLTDWVRTSVQVTTIYLSERNPDLIEVTPDSVLLLQRNVDGQRNLATTLSLDPGRVFANPGDQEGLVGWWARSFDPVTVTYSNGITSRFNRDAVNPSTGYQLGWGSREDFLFIADDTAATVSERDRFNIRGGIRLPGSAAVSLAYLRSLNETLDTRSNRTVLRKVWPDLRGSFTDLKPPGFLAGAVDRITLSSGYRREVRGLEFGVGGLQDRFREDREVPFAMTLGFPRGLSLSYRGRYNRGEGSDPTGDTRREGNLHSLLATSLLKSPLKSFQRTGTPLRVTLDVRYQDESQCRQVAIDANCIAFIDQLERAIALALDSSVRDFQLGVQFRYLDRRSFVGQKAGSTQFQLNVFGQFLLTPGMFPTPR